MVDHDEASSSNVPQDGSNVQLKPSTLPYIPPPLRRQQAPRSEPSTLSYIPLPLRRQQAPPSDTPKFISVALFTQREPLCGPIVLSMDHLGDKTTLMKNTPRREIRNQDGRRVNKFRELPMCMRHNGGIENWSPYNCYLFFDLLWGPSFGRDRENDGRRVDLSLNESISQLHTLLLGVWLEYKTPGFEINDGRGISSKGVNYERVIDRLMNDPQLRKSIYRRGAVFRDVVQMLVHEYRTHGQCGYFTLKNYVELLLHINESHSLEDLFSKAGCMPAKLHYRDLPLPQLLVVLKEAFGEDIYVTLVDEGGIHYFSSLGCRFFFTGEKISHNMSSSVRGLLSRFNDENVIVRIESIEWRREVENRKLASAKIIEEQKERKCEAMTRIRLHIGSLRQLFKSKASIEQLRWQPPDVDFLKLNTHGISRANLAAAGGLLRDMNGRFFGGFLDNLGEASLDRAEIWALFEGLTLAWQLDFKKISVDICSIRVVELLTACEVHNPLFTLVEYCTELLSRDWTCCFTYAPPEANRAAHGLAEQGFWIKGFVRLSTLPREIETFLIEDSPGASAWLKEKTSLDKRSKVDLEEKAKEIVSANPVVVFSKTYCSFCASVKKLFSGLGATFKTIELDHENDGAEIQSALAQWTGQRTVPNVFISGNHIGGCYSVTALDSEKKLVPMLTEAGALPPTKVSA